MLIYYYLENYGSSDPQIIHNEFCDITPKNRNTIRLGKLSSAALAKDYADKTHLIRTIPCRRCCSDFYKNI